MVEIFEAHPDILEIESGRKICEIFLSATCQKQTKIKNFWRHAKRTLKAVECTCLLMLGEE